MDQYYEIGTKIRSFVSGLLQAGGTAAPSRPDQEAPRQEAEWGPRIQIAGLGDVYHPSEVKKFAVPPGGIDNLTLSSIDKFLIPGKGEFTVNFDGFFRIARDHPTANDWATAAVHVNMLDMALSGTHPDLGPIKVTNNPTRVSAGQTFGPGIATAPAACRIGAAAIFELPNMGMKLVNKEPILLMNDGIESIPPVEDPNGAAHIYRLPLFDQANPSGLPVAYLTSLRYTIGNYVTRAQAVAFMAGR